MFFEDITKGVVKTPVADIATLGGTLDDTYTEETVSDILKNLDNATKPR